MTLATYTSGAELMAAEGVGFSAALARAYLAAGEREAATLRAAFPGYFGEWDALLERWEAARQVSEALRAGESA